MKLTFYGAAGEVTGSNFVLESGNQTVMVDCGLHQGSHYAERQNFEPFPFNPKDIHALLVTHAHLDHIGRVPKLCKEGFRGPAYSTKATKDFAELMLLDSEHILRKEAEREKKPPLYAAEDVGDVMRIWQGINYHERLVMGDIAFSFFDAGHILGSAIVKIEAEGKTVVFSGDLGNSPAAIIRPTEAIKPPVEYCVLESTYGDRVHEHVDKRRDTLEDVIEDTVRSKGALIIPAFALERTQELLYHLNQLFEEGRVPRVPVFIDSPLAIKLTAVYKKYESYFNPETQEIVRSGDDILNFPGLRLTLTTEQSKDINDVPPPKIIIAGSGMSQGGRILHHEVRYLPDPKSTILFVGYQAKDSLGRRIMDGADEVTIFGERVPVRSKKVVIPGYSAHADQQKLLLWVKPMRTTLKNVWVVHGEKEAGTALAQKIRDEYAVAAEVPKSGETVEM